MSWATRFEARQFLKGSLWVLPLLGGLLGTGLAQVTLLVDDSVRLPSVWNYSASTASGVLTAIVGAMVALIGFVVTIGVLVVQQTTGTLSPRYMRLWYRDRLQKAVLATFLGTFTFAYSLLRRVEDDHVPDVGVTTAGIAVAASIGLLLRAACGPLPLFRAEMIWNSSVMDELIREGKFDGSGLRLRLIGLGHLGFEVGIGSVVGQRLNGPPRRRSARLLSTPPAHPPRVRKW